MINDLHRQELNRLCEALRTDAAKLSATDPEAADRLVRRADALAREVNRPDHDRLQLESAAENLKQDLEKFEASHPQLVQNVGLIATTLANMGI